MDNQFNKQDFEKLLRENANQYRMFPSEKVWTGVHAALHTGRKWYRITALSMLLLSVTAISLLVMNYTSDKAVMTELENSSPSANTALPSQKFIIEKNNSQFSLSDKAVSLKQQPVIQEPITGAIKKSASANITPVKIISNSNEVVPVADINNTEVVKPDVQNETDELNTEFISQDNNLTELVFDKTIAENESEKIDTDSKITDAINLIASLDIPIKTESKKRGLTAQVYFTPTISYRKLRENNRVYPSGTSSIYQFLDLKNAVNHKPATGLEFGVEGKYSLNDRLSLKSGFQFNVNRYDIKAYSAPTEIATVAVSTGYRTNYLSTLSKYRNFNGNNLNWLENFNFQVTIPLGAEFILAEKKNFNWGISGSIQPTYVISNKAYLISSDYQHYAEFPDLMRRWNLSTGFETFITYNTGSIKWQTGPHLRYQHLSSYVSGYPVKENLFAVGLKIAATFNQR